MNRIAFVEDTVNMLLAQGSYAMNGPEGCAYRTDDGKKCAFGAHIPDALYHPAMEGVRAAAVLRDWPEVKQQLDAKYGFLTVDDMTFANMVQRVVHDDRARDEMPLMTMEEAKTQLELNPIIDSGY